MLRVLNGVRVRFFDVLAAQRLLEIHGELARINDDAVRTTDDAPHAPVRDGKEIPG